MNSTQLLDDINKVLTIGGGVLAAVGSGGLDVSAEAKIAVEVGSLVTAALHAWSNASGTPITPESILALMPDETPLNPPSI